ncbi:unnamed protein product [Paramecium sonneborni]|uniref:Uncharacterized protein n=1 Tax=Paramecium sonneborni TaxID=65129 RepID=A0A8S1QIF9_9CILI|nr:unnamed protein product [Paramecium sonneborni]
MSKEIHSTEIKGRASRKHFPQIDIGELKPKITFLDSLMQKKYQLNTNVNQYTLGKVYLESQKERVVFRVFQDSDLNISSIFQNKLNKTTVDDDMMTTYSQISYARKQNKKDLIRRIYEKEKWPKSKKESVEEMEQSLFGSDEEPQVYCTQKSNQDRKTRQFIQSQ